jgi:hypothetical protein
MPIRSRMLALSGPRRTDRGNGGRPAGTFLCRSRMSGDSEVVDRREGTSAWLRARTRPR